MRNLMMCVLNFYMFYDSFMLTTHKLELCDGRIAGNDVSMRLHVFGTSGRKN